MQYSGHEYNQVKLYELLYKKIQSMARSLWTLDYHTRMRVNTTLKDTKLSLFVQQTYMGVISHVFTNLWPYRVLIVYSVKLQRLIPIPERCFSQHYDTDSSNTKHASTMDT